MASALVAYWQCMECEAGGEGVPADALDAVAAKHTVKEGHACISGSRPAGVPRSEPVSLDRRGGKRKA